MKSIKIKYSEARSFAPSAARMSRGIRPFLEAAAVRFPTGYFWSRNMEAVRICRAAPCEETRALKKYCLISMFTGSSAFRRLFPESAKTAKDLDRAMISYRIPYSPKKYLYHFTPEENLDSIMRDGIDSASSDAHEQVYLMPHSRGLRPYFYQKTLELKRDVTFIRLVIDAKKLAREHELYYYHLYAVACDRVPPECIIKKG